MENSLRSSDIKILMSIGLSKSESIIYLDLVKNSASPAVDIARRVGFHRPNVYDSLRRLKEVGLVMEILENNLKKFQAIEPKGLKLYWKQKESELDKLIFELEKIPRKKNQEEIVAVLEGVSIKRELLNILNLNKPIFISMNPEFSILNKKFLKEFDEKRVKKKIPLKVVFSKDTKKLDCYNKLKYFEAKVLNFVATPNLVSIIVGDCFYYLQNKEGNLVLIKIKNKEISEEKQAHFNHVWNMKP